MNHRRRGWLLSLVVGGMLMTSGCTAFDCLEFNMDGEYQVFCGWYATPMFPPPTPTSNEVPGEKEIP